MYILQHKLVVSQHYMLWPCSVQKLWWEIIFEIHLSDVIWYCFILLHAYGPIT